MSELRQRANQREESDKENELEKEKEKSSLNKLAEAEDSSFSWLDVARSIVFLLLLSGLTSYFITRNSFVWNVGRPSWTRPAVIQAWINGPKEYTDEELKAYDGTDPDKPIFLAINGTIYDVSNGRRHYGPGGSYHFFAGADASRSFVTTCFKEDITPDMRGVETMFLPVEDPEIEALYPSGQLKSLKEQERQQARDEVNKALGHWVEFFAKSKKYTRIGTVKREPGWEEKGEPPKLCEIAEKKRPRRKRPEGK